MKKEESEYKKKQKELVSEIANLNDRLFQEKKKRLGESEIREIEKQNTLLRIKDEEIDKLNSLINSLNVLIKK